MYPRGSFTKHVYFFLLSDGQNGCENLAFCGTTESLYENLAPGPPWGAWVLGAGEPRRGSLHRYRCIDVYRYIDI